MAVDLIHARWWLSICTSNHFKPVVSERSEIESSIWSFTPSCSSMASSLRSLGSRGEVLSMVEGTIMTARSWAVDILRALKAVSMAPTEISSSSIPPKKNPLS